MSYKGLLRDRVEVWRATTDTTDLSTGSAVTTYNPVYTNVRCNLDLQYIRKGRDPVWTPEASTTPQLRKGVAFFLLTADVQDGDRLKWTKGGSGVFTVERGVDTVRRPGMDHHIEIWIEEIAPQIARGM